MTEDQVVNFLLEHGFVLQTGLGWDNVHGDRPRRLEHPSERGGSLYAAPDFLAATGPFKRLQEHVAVTGYDRGKYPYWERQALAEVLQVIAARYAKPDA